MTKRRRRKLGIGFILVLLVIVIGKLVLNQLNRPVNGVIKDAFSGESSSLPSFSIDMTPKAQVSPYVTFNYPAGLKPDKPSSFGLPTLQQLNYVGHDIQTWLLATSVSQLPGGNLSANSSYSLRKDNPTTYQALAEQINRQSVVIMIDKTVSDFSEVAFMPHGNLIGVVSLTGDDAKSSLLKTAFNMTVQSWKWH